MIYDFKLINDYINGEEIEDDKLEELENNPEFMKAVFNVSNDPKIYSMCSKTLKNDYDFVMFLIDKFKDNHTFVDDVASNYLNSNPDEHDRTSVIVKLCKLFEKGEPELFAKYRIVFLSKVMSDLITAQQYKLENPQDSFVGFGFVFFHYDFKGEDDTLEYIARQVISFLLDEEYVNLERAIHKEFSSEEDLDKYGLFKYMTNFLGRYDTLLSEYATVHPNILDGLRYEIKKIKEGWETFSVRDDAKRFSIMYSRIEEYMKKIPTNSILGEYAYVLFIANELGIKSRLMNFDFGDAIQSRLSNEDDEEILELVRETISTDIQERKHYLNIKKIMLETIFDQYEEEKQEQKGEKGEKGTIIHVDFSRGMK
jgi:hypothetical protein